MQIKQIFLEGESSILIGLMFFGGPFFHGFWVGTSIPVPVSISSSVSNALFRDRAIFLCSSFGAYLIGSVNILSFHGTLLFDIEATANVNSAAEIGCCNGFLSFSILIDGAFLPGNCFLKSSYTI